MVLTVFSPHPEMYAFSNTFQIMVSDSGLRNNHKLWLVNENNTPKIVRTTFVWFGMLLEYAHVKNSLQVKI